MDYVRIGILQAKGSVDEVNKLARDGMLPIFRKMQGFISYDIVPAGDGKTVVSISRWRTKATAEEGGRSAVEFARNHADVVTVVSSYVGPATVSAGREESRPSAPSYPS
ncbi:MAG: hypothetical protein ACXVEF_10120 [Polyangiales bacterium]